MSKELEKEDLEKIENELKQKKVIPKEVINNINQVIFENIVVAIIVMVYFYLVNLGSININASTFITDLKVFSISLIILTIILFEIAYKKDSGKICAFGIETLIISLLNLFSIYLFISLKDKFISITAFMSYILTIYYVAKSIVLYNKKKKEYFRVKNDIQEISKDAKVNKENLDNKKK